MTIQEILSRLCSGHDLSRAEAAGLMRTIMSGEAGMAQMGGLLMALATKGETVEEITGFAETMRAFATKIQTARRPLVDTCGTGGDRSGTFNISTAAAFVVAGAGVAVAKHGNRGASSKCGSADVLEALGVNIEASPEQVGRCVDEIGIGFLFARSLHGAMKHVAPVRAELGVRTVFNLLGPLTNPAGAAGQVMGIFDGALVEPVARVLGELGVEHAFVVHGSDGLDEFTLTGPTHVAEWRAGELRTYDLRPEDVGLAPCGMEALLGGEPKDNAALLRAVLDNEESPRRDIVVLNAAAAIVAGGAAASLGEGTSMAQDALASGAAREKLEGLVRLSHDS